jgi:hypothetical protein
MPATAAAIDQLGRRRAPLGGGVATSLTILAGST